MTITAQELTHEAAVAHKQDAVNIATKTWHTVIEPNPAAAVSFLNLSPAQGAGEASVSNRSDGRVDVYFFL
jgi:hypothetical protein